MARAAWTRGQGRFSFPLASPFSTQRVAGSCSSELGGGASVRARGAAGRVAGRERAPQLSADPGQARRDPARAVRRRPASDLLLRPVTVKPGQNIIRLNPTNLFPQRARVHHEVRPRARLPQRHGPSRGRAPPPPCGVGRERQSAVRGRARRRRSSRRRRDSAGGRVPSDNWLLNDMIHDLVGSAGDRVHRVEDRFRARHVSRRRFHAPGAHQVDGRIRAQPAGRDLEPDLPGVQRPAEDGPGRPLHVPRPGHRRPAQPHRAARRRGRPTTR